jgi:hypothetical protein
VLRVRAECASEGGKCKEQRGRARRLLKKLTLTPRTIGFDLAQWFSVFGVSLFGLYPHQLCVLFPFLKSFNKIDQP